MKSLAHGLRWGAVALALGLTALSVTAAAAATGHPARPGHSAQLAVSFPRCKTFRLTAWIGLPGDHAAGSVFYELQLSNVSGATCSLFGFPGVLAVNRKGQQLGLPASHDPFFPPSTVVLAPGGTAHAVLRVTNPGILGCPITFASGLKVFPPNTFTARIVPIVFQTCSGHHSNLAVRVMRPGAGIPGFSQ